MDMSKDDDTKAMMALISACNDHGCTVRFVTASQQYAANEVMFTKDQFLALAFVMDGVEKAGAAIGLKVIGITLAPGPVSLSLATAELIPGRQGELNLSGDSLESVATKVHELLRHFEAYMADRTHDDTYAAALGSKADLDSEIAKLNALPDDGAKKVATGLAQVAKGRDSILLQPSAAGPEFAPIKVPPRADLLPSQSRPPPTPEELYGTITGLGVNWTVLNDTILVEGVRDGTEKLSEFRKLPGKYVLDRRRLKVYVPQADLFPA